MPTTTPLPLSDKAKASFTKFVVAQRSEGLRQALADLLDQTDFRFIGIWRFQQGKAQAVVHVDRVNPETESVPEVGDTPPTARWYERPVRLLPPGMPCQMLGFPPTQRAAPC